MKQAALCNQPKLGCLQITCPKKQQKTWAKKQKLKTFGLNGNREIPSNPKAKGTQRLGQIQPKVPGRWAGSAPIRGGILLLLGHQPKERRIHHARAGVHQRGDEKRVPRVPRIPVWLWPKVEGEMEPEVDFVALDVSPACSQFTATESKWGKGVWPCSWAQLGSAGLSGLARLALWTVAGPGLAVGSELSAWGVPLPLVFSFCFFWGCVCVQYGWFLVCFFLVTAIWLAVGSELSLARSPIQIRRLPRFQVSWWPGGDWWV